jgi:GT2 family glycosyltransferase
MTTKLERIWIAEVELAGTVVVDGISRSQSPADAWARVLVRLDRQLLGFVSIPLRGETLGPDAVVAAVHEQLAEVLTRHPGLDWLADQSVSASRRVGTRGEHERVPPVRSEEFISVVVCTRDRPEYLAACLDRLSQLGYPDFEVVVVDNAPTTTATEECFRRLVGDDSRFRYVLETAPGLSKARNRGLREARARLVAFTDDDVRVDRWWLTGIAAGFARDARAGCVTGLAAPAQLDNAAQQYFDRRYTWASNMEERVFDLEQRGDSSPLYPYSAGIFGTGANFAVDRELFAGLGGFDEALGAGSPAGGGEDLDAFVRVLLAGRTIVYAPSAIVWHVHRADAAGLRHQLFYYGVGLTAFLAKQMGDGRTSRELLRRIPAGCQRARRIWNSDETGDRAPAILVLSELLGMLCGPLAYMRGQRRLTRSSVAS